MHHDLIDDNQLNKIFLKPRFTKTVNRSQDDLLEQFKDQGILPDCPFKIKVVSHHVVFDVKPKDHHFWSPQLHLELETDKEHSTLVKGLFGPKPQVWTFFMFMHFAVALTFFVFMIIAYSKYSLDKDYSFALWMCIAMLVFWVLFYIFGQIGKRRSHKQMHAMNDFLIKILTQNSKLKTQN